MLLLPWSEILRRLPRVCLGLILFGLGVLAAGLVLGGTIGVGTLWFAIGIGPMVGYFLPRLTMAEPKP